MTSVDYIFFELLQVAIGNRDSLSCAPSAEEWEELYEIAKKQALVGITFAGVERLGDENSNGRTVGHPNVACASLLPPPRRLRQWAVKAQRLQEKNERVSAECRMISDAFKKAGFDVIILKGQGNIANYGPLPTSPFRGGERSSLGMYRTPGDIDVWVKPKACYENEDEGENRNPICSVIDYCQRVKKGEYVYYHNLDFPVLKKTPVEVHYRPTWLFCPWRDRTLQKWMNERFSGVEYDGYQIPTTEFNVVFQLLHIYKHLFEEGIGLRQLMDYYWCLTPAFSSREGEWQTARENAMPLLKKLGLKKFTGAVMYVLKEVFALKKECMLCEPNEKEGKKLLEEIMVAGNFGHHDDRYNFAEATNGSMQYRGMSYAWMRLKRNFMFVRSYPMEVLFEPPFRVYHFVWRTFKLWRL